MARGWESKSVEEQQAESPQPADSKTKEHGVHTANRARQRQALELQRERILDERTSNPIRRQALESALKDIEAKLAEL